MQRTWRLWSHVECENTQKNIFLLVTWSNDELEDYKGNKDQDCQPIAMVAMTSILESDIKPQEFSKDVITNFQTHVVGDQIPQNPLAAHCSKKERMRSHTKN